MRLVSLSVMLLLGVSFIRQNTCPHARLLGSLSWSIADRTAYKEHLGSYKTRTAYDSSAIHRAQRYCPCGNVCRPKQRAIG
jgi:hypothetical protein